VTAHQSIPIPSQNAPSMAEARPVARLAVITHGDAERTRDALLGVAEICTRAGVEALLPADECVKHPALQHCQPLPDDGDVDLVLVLGGDGTTLRALHRFLQQRTPVIGVNFGRVGFLTTMEPEELPRRLPEVLAGGYEVVELPTLEVGLHGERHLAVNDVLVTSAVQGRMAVLEWGVNGTDMGEVGCDGIVVSSPSGSTAYNLSAGGPVLSWGVDAMVATFIAAHALDARPLVLSRGHVISIVSRSRGFPSRVVVDGHLVGTLDEAAGTTVRMAPETALLATLPDRPFLRHYRDTFSRHPAPCPPEA
jgi:NAD+ kinase